MSKNVKWDITYKCNLKCAHCVNGDFLNHIDEELTTVEIRRVIRNLREGGVDYVHLLGGEPTAREDILEIFSEFEEQHLQFGFNTNGLKLTSEQFRDEIVKNRMLKNIVFSIEGPTAEINDKIRGKQVFSITTNNLKEVLSLKHKYGREDLLITVNLVVSKINLHHVVNMIFFCMELGVNELVLLQFIPEGNGKVNDQSLETEEEIWLIKEIAQVYSEIKDKIMLQPKFAWPLAKKYASVVLKKEFPQTYSMCGAGNNFFYINNKGQLFPCDRYRKDTLKKNEADKINLVEHELWDIASRESFGDIYEKTESAQTYKMYKPCAECECLRKSCYPCVMSKEGKNMVKNDLCMRMMEEIKNVSVE